MNRTPAHTSAAAGPGLKWIALSAALGALGMWVVLSQGVARDADSAAPGAARTTVAASDALRGADVQANAAPWPATVEQASPSARAPVRARPAAAVETALPSPELGPPVGDPADYALDDATLARRARAQFGIDCPGIAERRARRSGRFEVICTNGLRLRVNLMGDGPPGITAVQ